MTNETWLFAVGVGVSLLIWAYQTFSKQSAALKAQRISLISSVTSMAYHFVEDVASHTKNTIDDKLAMALQKVDQVLAAQTGQGLTDSEKALAGLQLQATNGALKAAAAIAPTPVIGIPAIRP